MRALLDRQDWVLLGAALALLALLRWLRLRNARRVRAEAVAAAVALRALYDGTAKLVPRPGDTPAMHRARTMQAVKALRKQVGQ